MQLEAYKKSTQLNIVFTFSIFLVAPLLGPYLKEQGFFDWQISLMFMAVPLANIIFMPFFGRLADILGRRLIIWLGIWLEILALILYVIDGHWGVIVAARFLDGLAGYLVMLIILAKISDTIFGNSRGKYTGIALSLSYVGQMLAPLAGGFLADYFFVKLPFLFSAIILFILSFFLWSDKFKAIKGLPAGTFSFSWWPQIKLFLSHRQLRGVGIMGVVMHAAQPAMELFLPLLIVSQLGLSYKSIGIALFVYGISHVLQGVFGAWGDKWGHWRIIMAGTFLYGFCLISIYFIPNYWWLIVLMFIIGFGGSMWNIAAWTLMSKIGRKDQAVAQVLTSYFSIAKIGSLFSFLVSAWLVKALGISFIFLFGGVLIILGNFFAYNYLKPELAK